MNSLLKDSGARFDYAGYFITDSEWIHPDRTEVTYELICVTRGTVHMYDEAAGNVSAEKGQILVLEPGRRHYGTVHSKQVRFYWVHFHLTSSALPFTQRLFPYFEQSQLFRELLHLGNLPQTPDYAVNAVLLHILSELCRISEENAHYDRRAEEIYEWLRINASAGVRLETAAMHFGFSKDHLSRILKKSYGCGFKELTARFLTARARELLCNTELYVKEIAALLGFSSDKAFIGFFKYHEDVFPEQFRSRFSKTHMNNH